MNVSNLHNGEEKHNSNNESKTARLLMPGAATTIYKDLCHNFRYCYFHFHSLSLYLSLYLSFGPFPSLL